MGYNRSSPARHGRIKLTGYQVKQSRAWAGMTGVLLFGLSALAATAAGPPSAILSVAADASSPGVVRLEPNILPIRKKSFWGLC